MKQLQLQVNGVDECVDVRPNWTLLRVLRDGLGLLGTEEGCGEGSCGSCTVLVDGRLVRSCLFLGLRAEGTNVETVEGLADGDQPHPIQRAFAACGGIQCGFCTPGFVMTCTKLLEEHPDPSDHEINEFLAGNLCRCGSYVQIVEAVRSVVRGDEN